MAAGKFVVLMVMVALMVEGSRAMTLCDMNDEGLEACKPSVRQLNPVDPSPECCKALKGADLPCLCSYKNSVWLGFQKSMKLLSHVCWTFTSFFVLF
ncbi:hypothetical protein V6Z11_D07G180800 [Gossypium hirsutum]